jgi:type I restriction enzyme S subunit
MLRTTNVRNGYVDAENVRYVTEETYTKWTRRLLPKRGDILLTREAPLGDVGKIRTDDKVFLGQRLYHFRPAPKKLDADFLLYSLLGDDLQSQIKGFGSGSTVEHMRLEDIPSLEFNVPPLPVQQRIAGILSAYDELIENSQRRIKILEAMARALYREWFVHFRFPGHENHPRVASPLGEIPQGWEVLEFREIFDIRYGKTLPKTEISDFGPYPVYGAGDVIGYYDKMLYPQKCALVTSRGNGSGTVWRTREAAFVTNNSLVMLPKENRRYWDYSFVELLLKHSNVMGAKTGSAQPQVTIENLNYVTATVPTQSLIERFCVVATPAYEQVDLLYRQIQNLRRTRDLLLPRLLSGQIDLDAVDSIESLATA